MVATWWGFYLVAVLVGGIVLVSLVPAVVITFVEDRPGMATRRISERP
jgi:hypothetical protein